MTSRLAWGGVGEGTNAGRSEDSSDVVEYAAINRSSASHSTSYGDDKTGVANGVLSGVASGKEAGTSGGTYCA
jgi:hypothetical protein